MIKEVVVTITISTVSNLCTSYEYSIRLVVHDFYGRKCSLSYDTLLHGVVSISQWFHMAARSKSRRSKKG